MGTYHYRHRHVRTFVDAHIAFTSYTNIDVAHVRSIRIVPQSFLSTYALNNVY